LLARARVGRRDSATEGARVVGGRGRGSMDDAMRARGVECDAAAVFTGARGA